MIERVSNLVLASVSEDISRTTNKNMSNIYTLVLFMSNVRDNIVNHSIKIRGWTHLQSTDKLLNTVNNTAR